MNYKVLNPEQSYTFSGYFNLPFAPEDILADLGCEFVQQPLSIPKFTGKLDTLEFLKNQIDRNLNHINPIGEAARRATLIDPVIFEVADIVNSRLFIEYPVNVSNWLKGTIDYYLKTKQSLLVVEAKQSDVSKSFVQLGAELIGLHQWNQSQASILYGAVTTGEIWRFGAYISEQRLVIADRTVHRYPQELESVVRQLVGILENHEPD